MELFASLPMYDFPEIRQSTDRYWTLLREGLADHGFLRDELPAMVGRDGDPHADWMRPDLAFSQTCGLPFVRDLRGQVTLLGSPAYDIDCAPGNYFSAIVVSKESEGDDPADFAGRRFAFNDPRSQSGYAAFFSLLDEAGTDQRPQEMIESGSHRRSLQMVAAGEADIAAIDAVTFELVRRHDPAGDKVRVLTRREVTPGLPYICSLTFADRKDVMVNAIVEAMASLPEAVRSDLLLTGFTDRIDADYDTVKIRWDRLVEGGLFGLPA